MTFRYGVDGVAGFNLDGTEYLYKKDILNNVLEILSTNNDILLQYTYDAWGNVSTYIPNLDDNLKLDTNIIDKIQLIESLNPFTYRSYVYDSETKLYYLNSRYYDPEICRFVTCDDIGILNSLQNNVNGLNLYAYCLNNPINDWDNNGDWSWKAFWKVLAAIAIVVVVTAAVVATAGAVAVAAGASAAIVGGIAAGAAVGGLVSGFGEIISQSLVYGAENLNLGSITIETFGGSAIGALSGLGATTSTVGVKIASRIGKIAISGLTNIFHSIDENLEFEQAFTSFNRAIFFAAVIQGYCLASEYKNGLLDKFVLKNLEKSGNLVFGLKQMITLGFVRSLNAIWSHFKRLI